MPTYYGIGVSQRSELPPDRDVCEIRIAGSDRRDELQGAIARALNLHRIVELNLCGQAASVIIDGTRIDRATDPAELMGKIWETQLQPAIIADELTPIHYPPQ